MRRALKTCGYLKSRANSDDGRVNTIKDPIGPFVDAAYAVPTLQRC
jgi:hypothetical protein